MKRTALKRSTPLARAPFKRRRPMRQRARNPRDRGELADPAYLAYLRSRPCRVPGCPHPTIAHHLRHEANGAPMGAHIKDDRRAISLCSLHHVGDAGIHTAPWVLRLELVVDDLREWADGQLAEQMEEYARRAA